jgi:hypothetical protein
MNPIDFKVKRLKVKGQTGHMNILTTQYLEKPMLDKLQTVYTDISWKINDHYGFWGQKVKGQTVQEYTDHPKSWDRAPFSWFILNFMHWYILKKFAPYIGTNVNFCKCIFNFYLKKGLGNCKGNLGPFALWSYKVLKLNFFPLQFLHLFIWVDFHLSVCVNIP